MFTGTMIDQLIESVERAERHAHKSMDNEPRFPAPQAQVCSRKNWQEFIEVA